MILFSLLFSIAMAAAPAKETSYFAFSFGSHKMETIEISKIKIQGKERFLAKYLVDGSVLNQRLLPPILAKKVKSDFKDILKLHKADIKLAGSGLCTTRMKVTEKRTPAVYCADTTPTIAQDRISKWIKQTRSYF